MKIIMLVYFTYCLFRLTKNTPCRLNEKKFQANVDSAKAAYSKMCDTYPLEYHEAVKVCVYIVIGLIALIHVWLCTYLCIWTSNHGLKIMCYLETAMTIYTYLAHWKEMNQNLFSVNGKITYHKLEEVFGTILGYFCYITALIILVID